MNWQRTLILIIVIAVFGLFLRMYNVDWDAGFHLHPDERFMTMTANDISWPSSLAQYLDPANSPLSPYNNDKTGYIYGTFPLFLTKWVADSFNLGDYGNINLVGRQISAVFDTGTIILLFLIGRKIFNRHVGLLSALLYALVPLAIQTGHFFTVEHPLLFFVSVVMLLLLYFYEAEGAVAGAFLIGIALATGLAITCKISGLYLLPMIALVMLAKFCKNWKQQPFWKNSVNTLLYGAVFLLIGYLIVRFVQPYYFATNNWLDFTIQANFLSGFNFQESAIKGLVMFPPQWQWVGKTPYLFPGINLLIWGLGLPIGITSLLGVIYLVIALVTYMISNLKPVSRWRNLFKSAFVFKFLIIFWILFNFILLGANFVKTMRYFLPILPMLCLCAAVFIYRLKKINTNLAIAFGILIILPALFFALAYINIYSVDTTRVAASKWIYANVPDQAKIYNESWDDGLPLPLTDQPKSFQLNELPVYDDDNAAKLALMYKGLSDADYVVLSSARASNSVGKLPDKFPYMYQYYQDLDNGSLGFALVDKNASYPNLLGITFNDESAEEAFWVYDHPTVKIYQKVSQISEIKFDQLLQQN